MGDMIGKISNGPQGEGGGWDIVGMGVYDMPPPPTLTSGMGIIRFQDDMLRQDCHTTQAMLSYTTEARLSYTLIQQRQGCQNITEARLSYYRGKIFIYNRGKVVLYYRGKIIIYYRGKDVIYCRGKVVILQKKCCYILEARLSYITEARL